MPEAGNRTGVAGSALSQRVVAKRTARVKKRDLEASRPSALDVLPTRPGARPKPYRPPVVKPIVVKARQVARQRQHEIKDTKGDYLPEAQRQKVVNDSLRKMAEHVVQHPKDYKNTTLVKNLAKTGLVETYHGYPSKGIALQQGGAALKILDQLSRPSHAIAGATRAAVRGEDPVKAAGRGIKLKDRYLFSDVLKEAGAPKAVQGAGGFVADVVTDPTTYATFGTASVARKAAEHAAADVAKKAAKAGLGQQAAQTAARQAGHVARQAGADAKAVAKIEQHAAKTAQQHAIKQVSDRAAQRAAAKAPKGSGVTVRFAGKEVPGIRRSTAAVSRVAAKPTAKVVPARLRAGTRDVVRQFAPATRTAGVDAQQHAAGRAIARRARATVTNTEARALALARDLSRRLDPEDYKAVIDAIERNDLSRLPTRELAHAAHDLRSALKGSYRVARRAGVLKGKVGQTTSFLGSADLKTLRRAIKAEPGRQARRIAQLQRHEQRAQGKAQVAEAVTQGSAQRKAAVATERAHANRRIAHHRARGAAATDFERALASARVSTATTKTSHITSTLRSEHAAAKTALRKAEKAHAQAASKLGVAQGRGEVLSRNVSGLGAERAARGGTYAGGGYGVASATKTLAAHSDNVAQARAHVAAIEQRMRTERTRIAGVAPKEADRLRGAQARREELAATPAPTRVREPIEPPTSARAKTTAQSYERRAAEVHRTQLRHAAAQKIPERSLTETHEQYLQRLVAYADRHGLTGLADRATKLLKSKPDDIARGFFPRDFDDRIVKQLGLADKVQANAYTRKGPGAKVSRLTPGYRRSEQRRLDTVNPARVKADQTPFSTNIPLVTLNHMKSIARMTSESEFKKEMAQLGRSVKSAADLHDGEAIYKLGFNDGAFGLHPVTDIPAKPTRGGQYVALPTRLVDDLQSSAQRVSATNPVATKFDKATGGFKRIATTTLAFHARNFLGDLHQSYLATPGHRLPVTTVQAGRAVRRASEQARTIRPTATDKTIKVAGQPMGVDEFLASARREGVLDAGFIGRELHDLAGQGTKRTKKVTKGGGKVGQSLDRWMTNRENLMRLATYKAQLDKGLPESEAAKVANNIHIDYGDLSELERTTLRRIFPFYTWTARSLPVTTRALIQHPGKFATIEKAREETGKAFTGEDEPTQRARMTDAVKRQLPFVIKVGSGPTAVSASMPSTLLNELPTGVSAKDFGNYIDELGKFTSGMLSPLIKAPIELRSGVNLATRREIENKSRPLVTAPAWVSALPNKAKEMVGAVPDYIDPKTGKKTWGWRGRADWTYDQVLLGGVGQAAALAGSGRSPTSTSSALSSIAGVRADSLGATETKHAQELRTFSELDQLNRRAGVLNQQGINASNPTAEYRKLRDRINKLQKQQKKGKPTTKSSSGGWGGTSSPSSSGGWGS